MLEKLRKFSNSFFAKIFLFIIAIPFVFWGMGDLFTSGSQKTIVKIEMILGIVSFIKLNGEEKMNKFYNFFIKKLCFRIKLESLIDETYIIINLIKI